MIGDHFYVTPSVGLEFARRKKRELLEEVEARLNAIDEDDERLLGY